MDPTPRVHVIVVNYRTLPVTMRCIDALMLSDWPNWSLTVVDNGSGGDEAAELANHLGARYPDLVVEPAEQNDGGAARCRLLALEHNVGFGAANNRAMAAAGHDPQIAFFWLLNSDTLVGADALTRLVEVASRPGIGMAASMLMTAASPTRVEAVGGGRYSRWRGMTYHDSEGATPESIDAHPRPLDFACAASVLVRRELFEQIGGFRENLFLYGEDLDWSLRAASAGWSIVAIPRSRVTHFGGASSPRGEALREYYSVRNHLLLTGLHHPWWLPTVLGHTVLRRLLPRVLRRQMHRAHAVWRGMVDGLLRRTGPRPARAEAQRFDPN